LRRCRFFPGAILFTQGVNQLLAAPLERLLRLASFGLVAQNFHETNNLAACVVYGHEEAIAPKTRAVLAQMPALVAGSSFGKRLLSLKFGTLGARSSGVKIVS
jgi:hypothetical protein